MTKDRADGVVDIAELLFEDMEREEIESEEAKNARATKRKRTLLRSDRSRFVEDGKGLIIERNSQELNVGKRTRDNFAAALIEVLEEAAEMFEEEFPGRELPTGLDLLEYWAERYGDCEPAASEAGASRIDPIDPAHLSPGAVHAAGHAVVACLLDVPVKYITLRPAQCRIEYPPDEIAPLPRWIVQGLAALEAERVILDLYDPDAHQTDEDNASFLLDRMTAVTGRRHTAEPFRKRARALVIEHRGTIEVVAGKLMQAGRMSGDRIAAIVKGRIGQAGSGDTGAKSQR